MVRLPRWQTAARKAGLLLLVGILTGAIVFVLRYGREDMSALILARSVAIGIIYTGVMWSAIVAATRWMSARFPMRSERAVALHVAALTGATLLSFLVATAINFTVFPVEVSGEALLIIATIAAVISLVWSSIAYMRRFHKQMRAAEAAMYDARLQALRAQINPHFLFNAFNAIAALIRARSDEAETVVEDLAELFRYTLRASDQDAATLEQELEAARLYLSVEKARFRDRLQVEIDVPDDLRSAPIPSMTLQPLVENAVQHGVGETNGPCTVAVTAETSEGALALRVTDTGPGFDTTDLDAALDEGSGLRNVHERLQLFYGEDAQMTLHPQGVELRVPSKIKSAPLPSG